MNDEDINRAIAEQLGLTYAPIYIGDGLDFDEYSHAWRRNGKATLPPNYCCDLNAMHEAEKTLENHQLWMVTTALAGIVHEDTPIAHATARQRAEAFLRTVGKWRGEE